ncbi:unnamed protein product, partial [Didymodactylos carnosus]
MSEMSNFGSIIEKVFNDKKVTFDASLDNGSIESNSCDEQLRKLYRRVSLTPQAHLCPLICSLKSSKGDVSFDMVKDQRPLHGTTIYIANCELDTRFGVFHAYIFQDLISKHYIIALTYGEIHSSDTLHVRIHSSCVSSETLRGCDCDCVEQLEGAIKIIAENEKGILFYLLQEGRGAGYIGKSRDRMLVQASDDEISTFQAYHVMGLKTDHRQYENIPQVCHLLGIDASFIVLTNNPDKIKALKDHGLKISGTLPLEIEPSPFNLVYLASKAASGHTLKYFDDALIRNRSAPPEPVIPFKPHALEHAKRFIFVASYFLPMKPVDAEILLTDKQFLEIFKQNPIDQYMSAAKPVIRSYKSIRNNRFIIKIDMKNMKKYKTQNPDDPVSQLTVIPYWFFVHVYYDIVTGQEFIVLTHGTPTINDHPMVRIHGESLFNRFPLRRVTHRDKLKKSVQQIIDYGVGGIFLLTHDGRGAGFGAYVLDRMMMEENVVKSTEEAHDLIGIHYDSNDYDACMHLIKHHFPLKKIQ